MLVRMVTTMAGPGGTFQAGSVADLEQALALELIDLGYATAVDDAIQVEMAVTEQPERAVSARGKRKPGGG